MLFRSAYVEVSLAEYSSGKANWSSKPSTMINKVAISQCVREAFPKDYEGLYSEEEMIASGAIPANYTIIPETGEVIEDDPTITQEQRQTMFKMAQSAFGAEEGNNLLKRLLKEEGYESTHELPTSVFNKVVNRIMELKAQKEADDAENGEQGEEAGTSDNQ